MAKTRIELLIDRIKFLKDKKYYKNNRWLMAHGTSWVARGKCGGCDTCGKKYYHGSLENTRSKGEFANLCRSCITKIEDKIGFKFIRDYCS